MRISKSLLVVVAGLACCVVGLWFSTSIHGIERTYEVQPQITIPEYRTDAARAIDAYERLMERYMDLTEGNLIRMGVDIQEIAKKLDSIDTMLKGLSAGMVRVEKALGVECPKPPVSENRQFETIGKQGCQKTVPRAAE